MTKAATPPADADGYWHYTYITYHPDTFEWYGGKHSTSNLRDGYLGSGNWVLNHPAPTELVIEIVEFFYSEEHAYAAEAVLVNFVVIEADPLCRNERDGGFGLSCETARRIAVKRHADPEWRRQISQSAKQRFANQEWASKWRLKIASINAVTASNPEWRRKMQAAIDRRKTDPKWHRTIKEVGRRNAANPEWQRKIREGMARRNADPEWRRKTLEGIARRDADPEWQRKVREVGARNAANPEWLRKVREGIIRRDARRRERGGADKLAG